MASSPVDWATAFLYVTKVPATRSTVPFTTLSEATRGSNPIPDVRGGRGYEAVWITPPPDKYVAAAHSRGQFSKVIHRYRCQGAPPTAPNFQPWITRIDPSHGRIRVATSSGRVISTHGCALPRQVDGI